MDKIQTHSTSPFVLTSIRCTQKHVRLLTYNSLWLVLTLVVERWSVLAVSYLSISNKRSNKSFSLI